LRTTILPKYAGEAELFLNNTSIISQIESMRDCKFRNGGM